MATLNTEKNDPTDLQMRAIEVRIFFTFKGLNIFSLAKLVFYIEINIKKSRVPAYHFKKKS